MVFRVDIAELPLKRCARQASATICGWTGPVTVASSWPYTMLISVRTPNVSK